MTDRMELHGLGALVTGASRGLGRALALGLARGGARVAAVARDAAALEALAAEARALGGEVHALPADLGARKRPARVALAAQALAGPLELVVHAAATLGPVPLRPLLDTPDDDLERAFALNVLGPWRLTRAVAGGMALRGRGTIVVVGSDAAVVPYAGWGAYGASKAAVEQLARIWAAELAPAGVRVVVVDPGEMDTQMHAEAVPDADPATLARPEAVAARLLELLRDPLRSPAGARLVLGAQAAEVTA